MDPSVLCALKKWPDVPAVFGWLFLDRGGNWFLRGRRVDLPLSIAFFNDNFTSDEWGRWYVQNGPQRVFVELEYLPFVWSFANETLVSQTGHVLNKITAAYLDEDDQLILADQAGPGRVADDALFDLVRNLCNEQGNSIDETALDTLLHGGKAVFLHWKGQVVPLRSIVSKDLPELFGFQKMPEQKNE